MRLAKIRAGVDERTQPCLVITILQGTTQPPPNPSLDWDQLPKFFDDLERNDCLVGCSDGSKDGDRLLDKHTWDEI
jgi:hypothetical protein